jgi:hypothetical protein
MFPPSDQQSLELHMLTMIQDLAASLLMEFEKWVLRAESTGTILKTPLDSQSSLGSEEVHTLGVPSIFYQCMLMQMAQDCITYTRQHTSVFLLGN